MSFHCHEREARSKNLRIRRLGVNGGGDYSTCPHCGGMRTTQLLMRISVIHEGNGDYSTDYRSSRAKATKTAKLDGEEAAEDGGDRAVAPATAKADRSEN